MDRSPVRLGVEIAAGDSDPEEQAQLASQLRRELLDLDVETVDLARGGEAPPGSKGIDLIAAGGLMVGLAKSPAILQALVQTVQSWLSRHPGRSARLVIDGDSIEVTGISSREQRRLVEAWLERHGEGRDER